MPKKPSVPAATKKPGARASAAPRSTMPYYIAAFFAAAAMAWYFFLYVPSKVEYFVGVRLRTLAVASSQVKTKAENLASAFRVAQCRGLERYADAPDYLRLLLPEVRLNPSGGRRGPGLHLATPESLCDAPVLLTGAFVGGTGTVSWDDVMAQAAEVSVADFNDLVLALPNGDVVWQREETTPRIGNLAQVVYAEAPSAGWALLNWNPRPTLPKLEAKHLPKAVVAKTVNLGGTSSLLLVQAVTLSADGIEPFDELPARASADGRQTDAPTDRTLFVAGLVPTSALQGQAMHIPLAWIVLLSFPVILLFLALPVVKLATLTSRERFSFADALVLLVAAIITAGLAAMTAFVPTPVDEETDDALMDFANHLEERMTNDMRRVLDFGRAAVVQAPIIRNELRPCILKVGHFSQNRCDLWSVIPDGLVDLSRGSIELDVVIWLDERGEQLDKWTTKVQVTGPTNHRRFQHFRDLTVRRLWQLEGDTQGLPAFTVEPVRAPTTAELGVLVAFPIESASTEKFLALNLRMPSVLDAIVPPGYGFAVIASDGKVVLHSDENRSLQENFFEEVGEPADVRTRATSARITTWSGDYHGRLHRVHMRPLQTVRGSPWRIVTFREMDPVLANVTQYISGTVRLALINIAALIVLGLIVAIVSKLKHREVRDLLNVGTVTRPEWLWVLVALVAVAITLIVFTHVGTARPLLDTFYVFFAALPFIALAVTAVARRPPEHSPPAGARSAAARALMAAELGLLVILVAALPAAGFARIVDRVQGIDRTTRWLEEMQRRMAGRHARLMTRVNGPAYRGDDTSRTPDGTRAMLRKTGFANMQEFGTYAYVSFLPITVDIKAAEVAIPSGRPETGQRILRFLLHWNPFPSRDDAGYPPVTADGTTFRLEPRIAGLKALLAEDEPNGRPASTRKPTSYSMPPAKMAFGLALLAGTIAALYWARKKLLIHAPVDAPRMRTVLRCLPRKGSHGVMLIGAPRTNKDRAVDKALHAIGAKTERRIPLLQAVADGSVVDAELTVVEPLATGWSWPFRAAAELEEPSRRWIHISNLETHFVGPKRRKVALQLLERLLRPDPSVGPRIVVVTTNVDPVTHFEEIFEEERAGIYDDAVPEVELSRFSLLLTRFHRCYLPLVADEDNTPDPWWNYDATDWKSVLKWETRVAPLAHVRKELNATWAKRDSVSLEELAHAIATRSFATYQLFWTSCTRREKLVLVQLAQEGFVTPQSADVVEALMAKGMIVRRPGPALFNHSFRAFLRTIERNHVVREWERVEGPGLWVVAGRLIASSAIAGALFFLLTQGYSVEALLPVLSGTGVFGVPLVRNLIARFSGRASTEPAAA